MADGVSTRNADESQRLSTQRTQSFRNESRPFRRLRGNASVERMIFHERVGKPGAGRIRPNAKKGHYSKWKMSTMISCCDSSKHDVAANGDSFAIGRRRGKPAVQVDGNKDNAAFQAWRKHAAKHKLPLKPGGRRSLLARPEGGVYSFRRTNPEIRRGHVRQTRSRDDRHRRRGLCVYPCPSMSVAVILAAILAVLIFICKSCVSWNHKDSKNDDRKPFTIFQESPPR